MASTATEMGPVATPSGAARPLLGSVLPLRHHHPELLRPRDMKPRTELLFQALAWPMAYVVPVAPLGCFVVVDFLVVDVPGAYGLQVGEGDVPRSGPCLTAARPDQVVHADRHGDRDEADRCDDGLTQGA
jgi:hypothetical protein